MKINGAVCLILLLLWVSGVSAQVPPPSGAVSNEAAPGAGGAGGAAPIKPVGYNWRHDGGEILAVSFSPDGQTASSVNSDGLIKFWSTTSGRMVRSIEHGASIAAAAFYGNKKIALAKGREGENAIDILDVTTGEKIETLSGHTRGVTALAFSPNGESILSGGDDRHMMLWGTAYGELTHLFKGHKKAIKTIAFSPDGARILSADGDIQIWDIPTGEVILSFRPHKKGLSAVAFSPSGEAILSAGMDTVKPAPVYSMKLWDLSKKKWWQIRKKPIATFGEYADPLVTALFSPDGKQVLVGTREGKLDLWEIVTGNKVRTFEEKQGEVHTGLFSRDGRFVLTAGGGKLNLWKTGEDAAAALPKTPKAVKSAAQKPTKKGKRRR